MPQLYWVGNESSWRNLSEAPTLNVSNELDTLTVTGIVGWASVSPVPPPLAACPAHRCNLNSRSKCIWFSDFPMIQKFAEVFTSLLNLFGTKTQPSNLKEGLGRGPTPPLPGLRGHRQEKRLRRPPTMRGTMRRIREKGSWKWGI